MVSMVACAALATRFGPRLVLLTGIALWRGWPVGPLLHRVCTLLFLPRPALGRRLWEISRSAEFRAHFHKPGSLS